MPVEIRELMIKVTVQPAELGPRPEPQQAGAEREELVAECVEQVLRILEERRER